LTKLASKGLGVVSLSVIVQEAGEIPMRLIAVMTDSSYDPADWIESTAIATVRLGLMKTYKTQCSQAHGSLRHFLISFYDI
jgi:hypothetical protein